MWALNNLFGGTGAEVDYYSLGGKVHFVQLLSHPPFFRHSTYRGCLKKQ